MNLILPANVTSAEATAWLQQLIRDFGPGFHPDTSPLLYQLPDGQPALTTADATALESSLDTLFKILGHARPYEIGAEVLRELWRESLSRNASTDYQ